MSLEFKVYVKLDLSLYILVSFLKKSTTFLNVRLIDSESGQKRDWPVVIQWALNPSIFTGNSSFLDLPLWACYDRIKLALKC